MSPRPGLFQVLSFIQIPDRCTVVAKYRGRLQFFDSPGDSFRTESQTLER